MDEYEIQAKQYAVHTHAITYYYATKWPLGKIIFVAVLATERECAISHVSPKGKLIDMSSYDILVCNRRATKI